MSGIREDFADSTFMTVFEEWVYGFVCEWVCGLYANGCVGLFASGCMDVCECVYGFVCDWMYFFLVCEWVYAFVCNYVNVCIEMMHVFINISVSTCYATKILQTITIARMSALREPPSPPLPDNSTPARRSIYLLHHVTPLAAWIESRSCKFLRVCSPGCSRVSIEASVRINSDAGWAGTGYVLFMNLFYSLVAFLFPSMRDTCNKQNQTQSYHSGWKW